MRNVCTITASAVALLIAMAVFADAEPIRLDCEVVFEVGEWSEFADPYRQTISVDFDEWTLQFANWPPLPIVKNNARFVTAIGVVFDASPVGGYVISLGRADGQLIIRGIGLGNNGATERRADGTCARLQF